MPIPHAVAGVEKSTPETSRSVPEPRLQRGELTGISAHIQQAALHQVLAQWTEPAAVPNAAEVAELMVLLVDEVLEMQVTDSVVIHPRLHSLLGCRLLAALRDELLRGWQVEGMSAVELAAVLVACERVRIAIATGAPGSFAAQLAGPDGLRLLIDVAHDLRSPLTSILFLAETIQRGQSGVVNEVQRRQLGIIYTAALGLSSVASDIIDATRSELLVEVKPVPFSIRGVLESVHDIVRPIAEQKKLTVRLTAPSRDGRLGHPVALSRVLLNLTTNALEFTRQGCVEIGAREVTPARVEFSVLDSGPGIDATMIPTVFDPVRRFNGEGDDRGGKLFSPTGLGLTICRKLVATMGSELTVQSRPGRGTRFFFELELPPCPSRPSPSRNGPDRRNRERRRRQERRKRLRD
jgi:signal transduction histidine kinase